MVLRRGTTWFGVALDAPDGPALGHFYADLLGWQIFQESPPWTTVAPSAEAGYNLAFVTEEHYVRPVWPAVAGEQLIQLHLDFEVDDLEEGVAHALGCGAELASYQPQEDVRVLLDPAGHPFCLYVDSDD